jgi:alpha-D-xyloside xylohydrolase
MKYSYFWKRMLCCLLAVSSCAAFAGCQGKKPPVGSDGDTPTGDPEKPPLYTTPISEVIISSGEDRLAVNFCREDMVHFRFAPNGEDFVRKDAVPESIDYYDEDYEDVCGEIEETDEATTIRTEGLTVTIDKTSLAITITDLAGNEIFKSAAEAFSTDGEGKTAHFVRDVATTEHFFGLGNDKADEFTTTDHRGTIYDLWLHDDNVHAIVPLWYSTSGYGVYLNNSNKGSISFTKDYSLSVEGGEMNFYFFYGPSFKTILTNWSELAGRMAMPPLYSLGLTYRGYSSWNENQLVNAITKQYDAGIAIDIAGVEPGWQTKTYPCTYAWSTKFTTDPKAFVDRLHALGLRVNLWEHPYVSPDATIYDEIKEYSLSGSVIGTRDWEGRSGNYAFGGLVPDLTMDEARELYWRIQNANLASIGIDGYKIDETDSWGASNSLDLLFPSGISNNAYHNLLGTLSVNLMHAQYKEEYNLRTFIYSRGNYSGMQRYATAAYTDYYGFDQFVMSVIAQSYSGTYYSPEIRDTSTKNDISYMRRAQLMFLTPFAMSNEYATQATVLGRNQAVIDCYTKYNRLHYQLIPYMYSLFWNQHNTGIGVTRSLLIEFQNDPNVYKINDQFMLGDSFMVCPVSSTSRVATVDIYLPQGELWMDYNTGYVYAGGQTIEYTCAADTLPLFVRMGAIVPLGHYGNNTSDVVDTTLTLDIYPSTSKTSFLLYEDDGESYEYENGDYAETLITSQMTGNNIVVTLGARTGKYAVDTRACVMQFHYRSAPSSVLIDGKEIAAASSLEAFNQATEPCYFYDANAKYDIDKILYVRLTDNGTEHTVHLVVGQEPAQKMPEIVMEGTLYECEANTNTLVGARVASKTGASGKAVVSNLGNDGKNTLTINNVKVAKSGLYDVEITYYNGEADARMLYITVNDQEPIPVYCYSTGSWSESKMITIPMQLEEGVNTITFGTIEGKGWAPDLDCVIVYDEETTTISMSGNIMYPSDAQLSGGLFIEQMTGAVGGNVINGFGASSEAAITYKVTSDREGPYQLNINYASPSIMAQKINLTVNGATSQVSLPSTNSTHLYATLNMTIYLQEGENIITLSCDGGPIVYECEVGGEYKDCNSKLGPPEGYEQSGGLAVGGLRSGNSEFTMRGIKVPKDGKYKVIIYVASGDNRTFRLKVNGEDTGKLYNFRTGHFHKFQAFEVELDLKEGDNTLTFYGISYTEGKGDTDWMPNFDYVILPDVKPTIDIRIGAISIE